MKIVYEKECVYFSEVTSGQVFTFENMEFLKIKDNDMLKNAAVRLDDGQLMGFSSEVSVDPKEARLIIE